MTRQMQEFVIKLKQIILAAYTLDNPRTQPFKDLYKTSFPC